MRRAIDKIRFGIGSVLRSIMFATGCLAFLVMGIAGYLATLVEPERKW